MYPQDAVRVSCHCRFIRFMDAKQWDSRNPRIVWHGRLMHAVTRWQRVTITTCYKRQHHANKSHFTSTKRWRTSESTELLVQNSKSQKKECPPTLRTAAHHDSTWLPFHNQTIKNCLRQPTVSLSHHGRYTWFIKPNWELQDTKQMQGQEPYTAIRGCGRGALPHEYQTQWVRLKGQ